MTRWRFAGGAILFVGLTSCIEQGPAGSPPPAAPYGSPTYRGPGPAPPPPPPVPAPTPATLPGSPGCGKPPARTGVFPNQHVQAMGRDRTYTLVVPDGYSPRTIYPVVFVLHGHGGNGAAARAQFALEGVAPGQAIVIYPDGLGGGWDLDSSASKNGDVALFDALLLLANNTLCVDMRRIFVTGFSNGAYMANQLGCRRGDRIRAVVSHSGGGPYENNGSYDDHGNLVCPGKAVAAMVIHGNADGTVAPGEGQKSIDHWSHANRCGGGASASRTPGCQALNGCYQPVVTCRVPGLGHALWSEGRKATWSFFDALR